MGACACASTAPPPRLPRVVHLTLVKENPDMPLGLCLFRDRKGIVVWSVDSNSVMSRWNAEHPLLEIQACDRICRVNGIPADNSADAWTSILAECRRSGTTVDLVVLRCGGSGRLEPLAELIEAEKAENVLEGLDEKLDTAISGCECAICLQPLNDEEEPDEDSKPVVLPCRHAFHRGCVEHWLARFPTPHHARCPVCRSRIAASRWAANRETHAAEVRRLESVGTSSAPSTPQDMTMSEQDGEAAMVPATPATPAGAVRS